MAHHGVSDERFALRAALRALSPETYFGYGLGRFATTTNVAIVSLRLALNTEGRWEVTGRSDGQDPETIDAGVRLRWVRSLFGWDFAEYGRDSDVFEILDGSLAGRSVDVAQPIGAFRAEQELAAWLIVPVHSAVARDAKIRAAVLGLIDAEFEGVLIAESELVR